VGGGAVLGGSGMSVSAQTTGFGEGRRPEPPAASTRLPEVSGPGPKPAWLKKRLPSAAALRQMEALLRERRLHTVCEGAACPNRGECFERGTATFLLMGPDCTRDCRFCNVGGAAPRPLDPAEPEMVADAAALMGLSHVVITSVTRDDLPDGGAAHFAETVRAVRRRLPEAGIEVLVPDFLGDPAAIDRVLDARPEVFNHNLETVPRLYPTVRPQADYRRSLEVLARAAGRGGCEVKTGLMVGLGETRDEVESLLREVRTVGVHMVTIGQYLRPSREHLPVVEYVTPETFTWYRARGEAMGLLTEAAPFVRSSYRADEAFRRAGVARG
jgi:lipoyl synthase